MSEPKSSAQAPVLCLESNMTIAEVGDLKLQMQPFLQSAGPVQIDGEQVEAIDGAGLQLLAALVKELIGKSVEVRWTGASESLRNAASLMGLAELLRFQDHSALT